MPLLSSSIESVRCAAVGGCREGTCVVKHRVWTIFTIAIVQICSYSSLTPPMEYGWFLYGYWEVGGTSNAALHLRGEPPRSRSICRQRCVNSNEYEHGPSIEKMGFTSTCSTISIATSNDNVSIAHLDHLAYHHRRPPVWADIISRHRRCRSTLRRYYKLNA